MTRIIAGEFGGRTIAVPPKGTRPTSDRVREALFSRLDHLGVVSGARVLDLFAGSGALGLEALSRGAAHATLVDVASSAVHVMKRNAATLDVADRVHVVKERAHHFVQRPVELRWDLVIADPPYDVEPTLLDQVWAGLVAHLAPGATVVLEWSTRAGDPAWPEGLEAVESKRYGDTVLHYAQGLG